MAAVAAAPVVAPKVDGVARKVLARIFEGQSRRTPMELRVSSFAPAPDLVAFAATFLAHATSSPTLDAEVSRRDDPAAVMGAAGFGRFACVPP
ncbi:MAG: hypothetical protein ACE37F_28895 [Nannocystaceae bacterium]|nr:hypothetical protein [bacterium]